MNKDTLADLLAVTKSWAELCDALGIVGNDAQDFRNKYLMRKNKYRTRLNGKPLESQAYGLYPNAYGKDSRDTQKTFYTKQGWLNAYALGYGYIEHINFEKQLPSLGYDGLVLELSAHGTNLYDVSAYNQHKLVTLRRDTYTTLTTARKAFNKLRHEIYTTKGVAK